MFNWVKELKDEIKGAVRASIEVQSEVARLQERVRRMEEDLRDIRDGFDKMAAGQQESLLKLRDRVAALEAQQKALHNDARLIAAGYRNMTDHAAVEDSRLLTPPDQ